MTSALGPLRARARRSPLFMSVVAIAALVTAIANSAASVAFPVGAGWERVVNMLVTADLVVIAAVLIVAAILTSRAQDQGASRETVLDRDGRPITGRRIGVLTIVGLALLVLDWALWLAIGLPTLLSGLLAGTAAYLGLALVSALFGPLWVLGTVFAVLGFHRGGSSRNRTLSLVGAVLTVGMMGLVVLVAAFFATGMVG